MKERELFNFAVPPFFLLFLTKKKLCQFGSLLRDKLSCLITDTSRRHLLVCLLQTFFGCYPNNRGAFKKVLIIGLPLSPTRS